MNMVIHDCRNPTNSIKIGLGETKRQLRKIEKLFGEAQDFNQKNDKLQQMFYASGRDVGTYQLMFMKLRDLRNSF